MSTLADRETPDGNAPGPGPATDGDPASSDDPRVVAAVKDYLAELEAGRRPDRRALLARHPEIAADLAECLAALEFVHSAAHQLGGSAAGRPADPREELRPSAELGDFRIVREVGRGGMGVVYEAEQRSLDRRVALKVLPFAAALDAKHLRRFQVEAHAAACLHHPNIVPVHGVGCERGVHYYAMQFIDGRTLADLVAELRRLDGLDAEPAPRDDLVASLAQALTAASPGPDQETLDLDLDLGPLPPLALPTEPGSSSRGPEPRTGSSTRTRAYARSVARLGLQAAEALEHAHGQGVLHRDIKPSNLLVDARGNLWVTDFGLARVQEDGGLTVTGDLLGTLRYMSPEQAAARRVVVDHRTDIYSLGVTLYEMLALRPAFAGGSRAEVLRRVIQEEPRPLGRLNPSVPADLETIVRKAMDKDPPARYASAGDLAEDLRRFLEHRPIRARRPSLPDRAAKWTRRHRAAAASLAMTAAILLVTTAVAGLLVAAKERQRRDLAIDAKNREVAARKRETEARGREAGLRRRAEDLAEQARLRLVQLNAAHGARLMDEGDMAGALPWFVEVLRLDGRDPERAEAHRLRLAALLAQCPKPARIWFLGRNIKRAVFGRDGRAVLVLSDDGAMVLDVATGEPLGPAIGRATPPSQAALSPDGRRLATVGVDHGARIWEVATGRAMTPPIRWEDAGSGFDAVAFSRDGTRLLTSGRNTFRVWDAATGEPITPVVRHEHVRMAVFSPDGRLVLTFGMGDCSARLWDAGTGEPAGPPLPHGDSVSFQFTASDVFSPDARRLITAAARSARIWDATTGELVAPPLRHAALINRVAFSPDGTRVVTASNDGSARVWDAATGMAIGVPMEHESAVLGAAFSGDGTRVVTASSDRTARVWDAAMGRLLLPPLRHLSEVDDASFGPDGRYVVTRSSDRSVRIWDLAASAPAGPRLPHGGGFEDGGRAVAFSPDGRTLATLGEAGKARLWEVATGTPLGAPLAHPDSRITGLLLSPDGRSLLTVSNAVDKSLVWDLATREVVAGPLRHPPRESPAKPTFRLHTWIPGGRQIASASCAKVADGGTEIRIWDAATGEASAPVLRHDGWINGIAFSPDGRLIAMGGGTKDFAEPGVARILVAATGTPHLPAIPTSLPCRVLRFSPDGRRLAAGCGRPEEGEGEAIIWDATTGRPLTPPMRHTGPVVDVAFSADGRRLLTASWDSTACLWDAATGALALPPMRHRYTVRQAAFSPDGRRILTLCKAYGSSAKEEVGSQYSQVWDAATGLPLTPPLGVERFLYDAAFGPDGRRVATAMFAGGALLWSLEPDRRSYDDLNQMARVLSGTRLDISGAAVPLQTEDLRSAYEDLLRRDPDAFAATEAQVLGWHHQQALACEAAHRWPTALDHLDRIIAAGPNVEALFARRFVANIELGRWREAAADLEARIGLPGGDFSGRIPEGYHLALFRLACGDRDGYRAASAALLQRNGASEDVEAIGFAAWSCVLGEGGFVDRGPVLALARRAAERRPADPMWDQVFGAALYRGSRYDEAVERLTASDKLDAGRQVGASPVNPSRFSPAYRRYFLAMAHHRLGHDGEAWRWLDAANAQSGREIQGDPGAGDMPMSWTRRLTLKLLRAEAEALLGVTEPSSPDDRGRSPVREADPR